MTSTVHSIKSGPTESSGLVNVESCTRQPLGAVGMMTSPSVYDTSGRSESVEVFDYVSNINASGEATDNAMVLLPRAGTPTTDFGFDGNAILLEVVFQAVGPGTSDITLNATGSPGGAYWTDEGFADDLTEIHYFDPSEVVVSTVTVN